MMRRDFVIAHRCATRGSGFITSRRVAIAVLAANLADDLLGALVRHDPRTLIGLPFAGAMIAYLCSRVVCGWIRRG